MIRIYFGSPGCGKTTLGVRKLIKLQRMKKCPYQYMYANFDQLLVPTVSLDKLGSWTFPFNSYLFVDEAGIEYNNRNYKSFPPGLIKWLKLHRHYGVNVDFVSQSWEDMDVTIRRLADELWYVKRVGPLTYVRRIFKEVRVDKESRQIVDGYRVAGFFGGLLPWNWGKNWFLFFRFPYYRFFDTHAAPALPIRDYSDRQPPAPPSLIQHWRTRLSSLLSKIKAVAAPESAPTVREAPPDEFMQESDPDLLAEWIPSNPQHTQFYCSSCEWAVPGVVALHINSCPQCHRSIYIQKSEVKEND